MFETKLLENCRPLPSNTNYKFKENISLVQLLRAIQKCKKITNYKVEAQILNLNTKVIGTIIKKGKNKQKALWFRVVHPSYTQIFHLY